MSNEKKSFNWKAITQHRLFLPIVCLLVVLLVNVIKTPNFFAVSIKNGVLYGYLVDVVNRASELVIVAIGMTLVTAASGGQDISVGAVMAVAAAVCCQILSGGQVSTNELMNSMALAIIAAIIVAAICGAFNGFLVANLGIQPMVATLILFTAGRVASSRIYSADANNIGLNLEMDAILAVALGGNVLSGGKFSIMGSVIGAYTIQALTTTLYAMNVSADQLPVYKAVVVIIIVVIQSPVFRRSVDEWKKKRALKNNKAMEGGH